MDELTRLSARNYAVEIDGRGNFRSLTFEETTLEPPHSYTFYELDGRPARAERIGGDGLYELTAASGDAVSSARLSFSAEEELAVRVEPAAGAEDIESWSMTLALPLESEFHLPEFVNIGRRLDRSIPLADFYEAKVAYNFLLVGCGKIWIRFFSPHRRLGRIGVHVERHDAMFLLTVTWHADAPGGNAGSLDGRIGFFPSLAAAMDDYERYLVEEVGVVPSLENLAVPGWVHNARLAFEIDMIRCYGEITHDYEDVIQIVEELRRAGCPPDTFFHITGWSAPFDSMYPTYRPAPELGGEVKFREMVDAIHRRGYRITLHTLGWGIDPFHPDIDRLMPYVLRNEDGSLRGYKLAEDKSPPSRRIRFRTDEVAIEAVPGKVASIRMVECPAICEATLTIGGLGETAGGDGSVGRRGGGSGRSGGGRLSVTINGRTHRTPAGASLGEYRIPFPVQLNPGRNTLVLKAEDVRTWSGGWYRIDACFAPNSVHALSSRPILMADTTDPGWIKLFTDEVSHVVTEYGIDCLYVDCTTFYNPPGSKALFASLRDRLPATPFSIEWCDSIEELGWFSFSHGAVQSLVKTSPKLSEISGRKRIPVTHGIEERYGWLDDPSPVCDFVKRFGAFTSGPTAFVPARTVAHIYPDRLVFADPEELHRVFGDAGRLNFVPMLRLNYRRYGVDDELKRFIRTLA